MTRCVKICYTAVAFLLLAATAMLLPACHNRTSSDAAADSLRRRQLQALDDSVRHMSGNAMNILRQRMREATDSVTYYEYSLRQCRHYVLTANSDSALSLVRHAISCLERQEPTPRVNAALGYAYNCAGAVRMNQHDPSAVTLYHKAYTALGQSDNKAQMPDVCANLADAYALSMNLGKAAEWYRRALFLADSLQLPKTNSVTLYVGLARVYTMLEDYDSAERYYMQTRKYFDTLTPGMQLYYINSLGNYYYYKKDYESALTTFRQMETMLRQQGLSDNYSANTCKINLADVLLNLGRVDEAAEYARQAESYYAESHDEVATYYVHTVQLGIALRRGDMATARRLAALHDEPERTEIGLRHIRDQYMCDYYEQTGNYAAAYGMLKKTQQENDSLIHSRQHMLAAEIMSRFAQDTLSLHHEIQLRERDVDVSNARSWVAAAVALVALLLLMVLGMLTYAHKKQLTTKMNILRLRLQNARNRISPHFVFNVLNNRIVKSDSRDADELLSLAQLIRANLDLSGRDTVTLKEELDFVDNYIDVERNIIGDGFVYTKDIAPGVQTDAISLPPMFIQILVENSIKHALRGKQGEKRLTVRVTTNDRHITISVTDNGPGFDIRRFKDSKQKQGLDILRTTISVINQNSKHKASLTIRNVEGADGKTVGSTAVIQLPLNLRTKLTQP